MIPAAAADGRTAAYGEDRVCTSRGSARRSAPPGPSDHRLADARSLSTSAPTTTHERLGDQALMRMMAGHTIACRALRKRSLRARAQACHGHQDRACARRRFQPGRCCCPVPSEAQAASSVALLRRRLPRLVAIQLAASNCGRRRSATSITAGRAGSVALESGHRGVTRGQALNGRAAA